MDISIPISTLYAGACGIVYAALSFRVINIRMTKNISVGDKQDSTLFYAIRGHCNFNEYVPLMLLLLGLAEIQSLLSPQFLHLLGGSFVLSRIFHASHFMCRTPKFLRIIGMVLTLTDLIVVSVVLLKASISL